MCKKPSFLHKAQNYNSYSVFPFLWRAMPAIRSVSRSASHRSLQLKVLMKIKLKKKKKKQKEKENLKKHFVGSQNMWNEKPEANEQKERRKKMWDRSCQNLLWINPFASFTFYIRSCLGDLIFSNAEGRILFDFVRTTETHRMVTCSPCFCLHHSPFSCISSSAAAFPHLEGYSETSCCQAVASCLSSAILEAEWKHPRVIEGNR